MLSAKSVDEVKRVSGTAPIQMCNQRIRNVYRCTHCPQCTVIHVAVRSRTKGCFTNIWQGDTLDPEHNPET